MSMVNGVEIIRLLRPEQWVKNLFVFLPVFFNGSLLNWSQLYGSVIAFISFCFIASCIYCLNDIKDRDLDRLHPEKSKRPIASGNVSVKLASAIMPILLILSIISTFLLPGPRILPVVCVLLFYLILNLGYTLKLKNIAVIDVIIVSTGFILRILAGGLASEVVLSPWIILMTFLLALFLAFAKRRDDILKLSKDNVVLRKSIRQYNLEFINQSLGILSAVTIVCYILYTLSAEVVARPNGKYVYLTTVFVITAILRYLQITFVDQRSGNPTKILLKDAFIQICILLWVISFLIIIYV